METLEQRVTNIESALRSQGISIPDCVQLRADVLGEPEPRDDGAIVIDGQPVVGEEHTQVHINNLPTKAEARANLEAMPMDDLRAIANDLPISNMHDLHKAELVEQILACAALDAAIEPEEPNGEA